MRTHFSETAGVVKAIFGEDVMSQEGHDGRTVYGVCVRAIQGCGNTWSH